MYYESKRSPFIILTEPRSGSNWLKSIVGKHPDVRILNEGFLLHNAGTYETNPLHPMHYSDEKAVDSMHGHKGLIDNPYGAYVIGNLLNWLKGNEGDSLVHGTKEADVALHLGWIFQSLPNLNPIILSRDLRGNVSSNLKGGLLAAWGLQNRLAQLKETVGVTPVLDTLYGRFLPKKPEQEPEHRQIALFYAILKSELERKTADKGGVNKVKYEDLVADPHTVIDKVLNFIGLPLNDSIHEYVDQTTKDVRAQGTYNVHRGKTGASGAFDFMDTLTISQIQDIESIARDAHIPLEPVPQTLYKSVMATQPERGKTQKKEKSDLKIIDERQREEIARDVTNQVIEFAPPDGAGQFSYASRYITNEQYAQFLMWLEKYNIPIHFNGFNLFYNERPKDELVRISGHAYGVRADLNNHPVVNITYPAAYFFSRWIGGRIPHFQEWQIASFTPKQIASGSVAIDISKANTGDYQPWTTPVDQYPPNQQGIYDWIGNVSTYISDPVYLANGQKSLYEKYVVGGGWSHAEEESQPYALRRRLWWQPASSIGIRVAFDKHTHFPSDDELVEEIQRTIKSKEYIHLGESIRSDEFQIA